MSKQLSPLIPIAIFLVYRLSCPHVCHNFINTPRLVSIPFRVIRLKVLLILHLDPLVHALNRLFVILVAVCFWVVFPHPFRVLWGGLAWVDLHFRPVGGLEELGVVKTQLLGASISNETEVLLAQVYNFVGLTGRRTGIGCVHARIEECSPCRRFADMKLARWHPR